MKQAVLNLAFLLIRGQRTEQEIKIGVSSSFTVMNFEGALELSGGDGRRQWG